MESAIETFIKGEFECTRHTAVKRRNRPKKERPPVDKEISEKRVVKRGKASQLLENIVSMPLDDIS